MPMKPVLLALSLAALAGCKREPDFEARYKDVSAQISQSAHDIDAQIAGTGVPADGGEDQ